MYQIKYGDTTIHFSITYAERKSLGIKVHPDKSVHVIAPINAEIDIIKEILRSKAAWVIRQQDFFLSFYPLTPSRRFISGETHLYLGRQYRLKIIESNEESVKLQAGNIYIRTKDKDNKQYIEKQMKIWYKQKAELHFSKLFEDALSTINKIFNGTVSLKLQWMDKRWGSCTKDGVIILNIELIKAPKKCIEYVIIHELCHLEHLNHSKSFYALLDKTSPDWRKTKNQLEHLLV